MYKLRKRGSQLLQNEFPRKQTLRWKLVVYSGGLSGSKPVEGRGRTGPEAGLGRESRRAAMQSKSGPEVTPQGMVEPGWPFTCSELGGRNIVGCWLPQEGMWYGWNGCEGCQLTSFAETAGEINPAVLRGGCVAHSIHTARNDVRFWTLINLVML